MLANAPSQDPHFGSAEEGGGCGAGEAAISGAQRPPQSAWPQQRASWQQRSRRQRVVQGCHMVTHCYQRLRTHTESSEEPVRVHVIRAMLHQHVSSDDHV